MTSFVQAERNENDPCLALKCDKNSYCVIIPESQTAHCECNQGYTASGRSGCQDLDECASGSHDCSENANCINEEGTYKCKCQSGFVGDGKECIRKITCQDLNCHENAMCIEQGSRDQPTCKCFEGYVGDGVEECNVVPTHLLFNGFTLQDEILINPNLYPEVVSSWQDIGPIMEHNYEISNIGPQTVANVEIKVSWPLKDGDGRDLSYLSETPKIVIDMGGEPFFKDCIMSNPSLINPKRLASNPRVKRQSSTSYSGVLYDTDDYYADNLGVVLDGDADDDELDYIHEMTDEEKALIDANYNIDDTLPIYEDDYDYSTKVINASLDSTILADNFATFTCSVNLAPQETAKLNVQAYVFAHELTSNYETVALFNMPSEAEVLPMESIILDTPGVISLQTLLRPSQPPMSTNPGKCTKLIQFL